MTAHQQSEYDTELPSVELATAQAMGTLKIQDPQSAASLVQTVKAIAESAKDYTVPTQKISMAILDEVDGVDEETDKLKWAHSVVLLVQQDDSPWPVRYNLRKIAHEHLAEKLGIGQYYYRKLMSDKTNAERLRLLAQNVNHWLHQPDETRKFLLRTINDDIRAVVSDRFFILDNFDLALHTINVATKSGALVQRMTLTEEKFNIRLVYPNTAIALETQADRTRRIAESNRFSNLFGAIDDSLGHVAHDAGSVNLVQFDDPKTRHNDLGRFFQELALAPDCFIGGVDITNSEVGRGGLEIRNFLFETYCRNTAIYGKAFGRIHHGAQNVEGLLSTETKQRQQAAVWSEVEDVIRTTFDPAQFRNYVEKLLGLQDTALASPIAAVTELTKTADVSFTDDEKQALINQFMTQGLGGTAYALVSAVTAYAQQVEDPDRARDLELYGGRLVENFPRELVTVR